MQGTIAYQVRALNLLKSNYETLTLLKDKSGLYSKGYKIKIKKVKKGFYLSAITIKKTAYKFLYHGYKFHLVKK